MSKYAATVINSIPGIGRMKYLELGVAGGKTFNAIKAGEKIGVDKSYRPAPGCLQLDTDTFFMSLTTVKFDVIFIDADHTYDQVVKDYNNSMRHLAADGWIFIHDLVPPDEMHTDPRLCGDGYKFLVQLRGCDPPIKILDDDYGLTAIRSWWAWPGDRRAVFEPMNCYRDFPFSHFVMEPRVDINEMIRFVKSYYTLG
jgi:hypothetical protein